MAIIEPTQDKDYRGVLLGAGVILLLSAIAFGVYWFTRSPKTKLIKLDEKTAADLPAGPAAPVPPSPPLPAAQDPGPTMITLDLKNVTPQQAIQALSEQAKVEFQGGPMPQPQQGGARGLLSSIFSGASAATGGTVNVSVTNQPFWMAFREVSKQASVYPYANWGERDNNSRIRLNQGQTSDANCPSIMSGSTMIVLNRITSTFNSDLLSGRSSGNDLRVNMTAFVEPKLKVYRISPIAYLETVVDEKGNSLLRPRDQWDERNNNGPRSGWMSDVQAILRYHPNSGEKIAKLKGYISLITVGKEETVKIKDPLKAKNTSNKIDTTNIRLIELRKQGGRSYMARFAVDSNSPFFKDWDSLRKVAQLVDADGKAYSAGGTGMGGGPPGTLEFSLYFNGNESQGEPTELQITLPTEPKEIRVPFEFTNIPLPH